MVGRPYMFASVCFDTDCNLPDDRETPRQKYIRGLFVGRELVKFIQTRRPPLP